MRGGGRRGSRQSAILEIPLLMLKDRLERKPDSGLSAVGDSIMAFLEKTEQQTAQKTVEPATRTESRSSVGEERVEEEELNTGTHWR